MNANAGFADACPEDPNRAVWAGGQFKRLITALSGIEHALVPAEYRSRDHIPYFPFATVNELFFPGCNWESGYELVVFPDYREFLCGIDYK